MYRNYLKIILDFILALVGITILLPIFIVVAFVLLIINQENPFFLQWRVGLNGKLFKIIKFKTMNSKKDENGNLLPDEERLTKIGSFIRKYSLDELPQLFNVLKGEMSLVGPRPLLPFYMDLYNDFQRRRNEVKPGITGWAQVNGRNNIPWKKRFELDVWYVDNMSFGLDIKILFLTIIKILTSENVNEEGFATASDFQGNDE